MGKVIQWIEWFTNRPEDLSSIPGRVISKTLKWYLILPCLTLSIIRYVSRVKWRNTGKGVVPSPPPRCYSHWKGGLWVTLDHGRQQLIYAQTRINQENETHKIHKDFEIQTDHVTLTRRPSLKKKKKKKKREFTVEYILSSRRITKWKSKKVKREKSS